MTDKEIELVTGSISLLSRFWLSESRISYPKLSIKAIIDHYMSILGSFLHQYTTAKGKNEMQRFFG